MFLVGWTGYYPDQTDWVDYHFGTGANDSFGPKFQDIETLLTAAASELDQAKRLDDYKQANTLLAQHVPMIPLFHASSSLAFKADVTGVLASALSNEAFWPMKAADRPTLVFEQNSETSGLYCGDESDGDALRNCIQIYDSLYTFKIGGTDVQPNLATSCAPNPDGTVWTCTLRDNVKFADGAALDANDVVDTYAAQWDSKNPLHVGNAGSWEYFPGLFGGLLNPPPAAP
jgi:ABC-type transport system substrate-binding protein